MNPRMERCGAQGRAGWVEGFDAEKGSAAEKGSVQRDLTREAPAGARGRSPEGADHAPCIPICFMKFWMNDMSFCRISWNPFGPPAAPPGWPA